jgi:hypothetical protein
MDEGLPIAYEVLEKGVPVLAAGGEQVGTVHHVVAAPEQDIFHGIVMTAQGGARKFVQAADVAALHEHGVDLRIDASAVAGLSAPHGSAPVYEEDPSTQQTWRHWVHRITGREDWDRKS